ncbi:MAG TPA: YybS family protein [Desulfuromonadales bacterium]|nr:YybS family protein [Desulfuromonadales bacterium]
MNFTSPADHHLYVRLKASILGVVGSFVLFAAYLAVPPLGIFSGLLAPFPATYNRLIHGRLSSLIVTLGSTALITALFGIFAGVLYLGMCAMISLLMPELLLRGISGSRVLFWTTAANLLIYATGITVYGAVSGINLQQLVSTEISGSLKLAVALYEKSGVTGEELELIKSSMAIAADLLKRLYPALLTAMLVVIAGCNLMLVKKTTANSGVTLHIDDFMTFKNPDLLVWLLIACGFTLLLPLSLITTPALNLLLIIVMLYFFQGMAVVSALIKKYSVPALLRILFYTMLVIQPYLLAFVAGVGIFDLWVDFRTPKPQENL